MCRLYRFTINVVSAGLTVPKHVEAYDVCSVINSHAPSLFYSKNESSVYGHELFKSFRSIG
jgi:hypothetical protein